MYYMYVNHVSIIYFAFVHYHFYVHTYVGLISYAQAPTICTWCKDVAHSGQQVEVVLPVDIIRLHNISELKRQVPT